VWIVSELYYPEETSTGYLLTRIAEELARRYEVGVLTAQPTYAARGLRAPRRERVGGVEVFRCRSTRFDKNGLPGRLVNAVTMSASFFLNALFRFRRGDVALFVTNPPLLPFALAAACRLRGATPLLLIHDVYPQLLVAVGLVRGRGAVEKLLSFLTRRLYRSTARVIAIGRDMAGLVAEASRGAATIATIPNWADLENIRPAPRDGNALLAAHGLAGKFVVQYAGNMGRSHDVEALAAAAAALRARDDIHFLLAGNGAKRPWLEQAVAGLPNVTLLPWQPRGEALSQLLNACDVSVIAFVPGMAGVSVPCRMYDVMASGRPLLALADPASEVAMTIEEEGAGWSVPAGDRDALVRLIVYAAGHRDEVAAAGRRARAAAERNYSLARAGEQYRALVAAVTGE
jgi:glycosyltransferase involved in cell wall biosynthesis